MAADNNATVVDTSGVVPDTPGPGETAFVFTRPPKIGDIFINRTDNLTWVRAADPAGAGDIWEAITGSLVHVTDVPSEEPSDHIYVWRTGMPRAMVSWEGWGYHDYFGDWSQAAKQ